MNAKISVFVICAEAHTYFMYLLLYNLHDWLFDLFLQVSIFEREAGGWLSPQICKFSNFQKSYVVRRSATHLYSLSC